MTADRRNDRHGSNGSGRAHGTKEIQRRTVTVKPWDYEPTEEELREEFRIDATPEQLARSLFGVRVIEDPEA